MFIKLRINEDRTDIHLAVSEIASFRPYDRYRPSEVSTVTMKDGTRYQVADSTDKIAELIMYANNGVVEIDL